MHSVECAVDILNQNCPDFLIHNAGAYSIPRFKTDQGVDNVFQINFLAPYYMTRELLPELQKRNGRVIFVGSIAHNYSKIDLTERKPKPEPSLEEMGGTRTPDDSDPAELFTEPTDTWQGPLSKN
jgi:hypothetical protein